jgi:trigger factor
MEAIIEKIENSEAFIEITIDAEKLEKGKQKAYHKVVKKVSVPGFRKGKVPRHILESYYGKEILMEDALDFIVPDAYDEAVKQLDITPISQPEFDFKDYDTGEGFKISVKVAVKPEVKLGMLEGLEIEVPRLEVMPSDIELRIEQIRNRYAEIVEKQEPAEKGDILSIDFEGFLNDEPFAGGKGENYSLELGSNSFIPGFEDQLIGVKAGEEREVKVTFPEDYNSEELAGQDAVFKVIVHKIETKKIRPLDDDFIQEVSEFETVEAFKDDIRINLEKMYDNQKQEAIKSQAVAKAVEGCEILVPQAAILSQAQGMLQKLEQSMMSQGLTLEQYFQYTNSNEEQFLQQVWPEAERGAKTNFVLEKIAEEKGFTVSDEELENHLSEIGKEMDITSEDIKKRFEHILEQIRFTLVIDKAVDYLTRNAMVKEIELKPGTEAEEPSA